MPIYEYSCKKCGKTIEVIQKFSDPILKKHKGCGGTLMKLISAAGFQFTGTGWYVTDYARKGSGEGKESSSNEKKEAGKEPGKEAGKDGSADKSASTKAPKKDSPSKTDGSKN